MGIEGVLFLLLFFLLASEETKPLMFLFGFSKKMVNPGFWPCWLIFYAVSHIAVISLLILWVVQLKRYGFTQWDLEAKPLQIERRDPARKSWLYMGVSNNSGFSPQIIHFRVFHYFHHAFWETPLFLEFHPYFFRSGVWYLGFTGALCHRHGLRLITGSLSPPFTGPTAGTGATPRIMCIIMDQWIHRIQKI